MSEQTDIPAFGYENQDGKIWFQFKFSRHLSAVRPHLSLKFEYYLLFS